MHLLSLRNFLSFHFRNLTDSHFRNLGFPTRMVYLYNDIESRYTILAVNPRNLTDSLFRNLIDVVYCDSMELTYICLKIVVRVFVVRVYLTAHSLAQKDVLTLYGRRAENHSMYKLIGNRFGRHWIHELNALSLRRLGPSLLDWLVLRGVLISPQ